MFRIGRFVWVITVIAVAQSHAQPAQVSYQGELKKDGLPYTGTARMKFAIVDDAVQALWSNDGTSVAGSEPTAWVAVEAVNGIFAVRLGAAPMEPISGGLLKGVTEVSLRVWVNTGDGFEQLTDHSLSSSAFSLSGEKCLEIGALQINVVPRWDGSALSPGALFDDGANVGVGTALPTAKLDVAGTVKSSTGGFQFPDGTVQTTAVAGGGGGVPSGAMILATTPEAPEGFVSTGLSVTALGTNTWRARRSMPTGRWGLCAVAAQGKVYAIGGTGSSSAKKVEAYDPVSDIWSTKSDMPIGRSGFGAAEVGGFVYVMGGRSDNSTTALADRYDPNTDAWTPIAPMPIPRHAFAAVSHDGKIYAIGGHDDISVTGLVEVYDPAVDEWTTRTSMPTPRKEIAAAVVNGQLLVVGGYTSTSTDTVEVYDPIGDSWAALPNLPIPVSLPSASAISGRVYVFGGFIDQLGASQAAYEYDPLAEVWTDGPDMPFPTSQFATAIVGTRIYALGGSGGSTTDKHFEFTPPVRFFVQQKE